MGPPPPAPLPDEIVEEILLRLPASDPASLARAAVARKRWFVALHRTPPMLGFLCDPRGGDGFSARFVPTSSFRPRRAVQRSLRPEDARHGRVLLRYSPIMFGVVLNVPGLVVWDPMTEKNLVLPKPPGFCDKWNWKATVLCAAPAGTCNHHDCHRGPFVVVVVANYPNGILSTVYSSQAGAWNKRIFAQNLRGRILRQECRPALVGNALHYTFEREHKILKYDLGTREFSVMEPPLLLSSQNFSPYQRIELTTTEDDQLGLAVVSDSTLHILSRDEEFGWGRSKIIYLKKWGLHVSTSTRPGLVAFAGDIGLAFLRVGNGIFSVNIKSPGVKKVYESSCISCFIPYVNFCTPGTYLRRPEYLYSSTNLS
ncbi:hypothetical protein HU200_031800 [Digitaria exilis]|uniref:F-box protein AT5G49610-like beta-propeller domain-containing protein n=1 Tax=Digitaria exilis TaxID=1010633 RepID=A0A835BP12_9POAL|nr:hypothetical protein HU200_031800 [Digitaria exilis]